MYYRICKNCGAHLDPGERCDCNKKETAPLARERPQTKEYNLIVTRKKPKVKPPGRRFYG